MNTITRKHLLHQLPLERDETYIFLIKKRIYYIDKRVATGRCRTRNYPFTAATWYQFIKDQLYYGAGYRNKWYC